MIMFHGKELGAILLDLDFRWDIRDNVRDICMFEGEGEGVGEGEGKRRGMGAK